MSFLKKKGSLGFALPELVITIGVALIASALAVPLILENIREGRVASLKENFVNIKSSFNSYYTMSNGVITKTYGILDEMESRGWIKNIPTKEKLLWDIRGTTDVNGKKAYYIYAYGGREAKEHVDSLVERLDASFDGVNNPTDGLMYYRKGDENIDICYFVYKDSGFRGRFACDGRHTP